MILIESLKDYIEVTPQEKFIELATKIYITTDFINNDYPDYKNWCFTKQLPGIIKNERNILFARNPENKEEIIAIACLKKAKEEQKICTLYVSDNARGLGIGSAIIEESMKWLGTTKPFITFPDYKLDMFKPFIEKYAWNLTEKVYGLYKDKTEELCFNGAFNKDKKDSSKHHKKLMKALNTKN